MKIMQNIRFSFCRAYLNLGRMKTPELFHLLSLVCFGFNGVTAFYIDLSSLQIVVMRLLLGCLFLLPFGLILAKKGRPQHSSVVKACAAGAFMGASWIFLYDAYRSIGVAQASVIYYFGPVLVMAATALLRLEKINPLQWLCLIAAFCGLIISIEPDQSQSVDIRGLFQAGASAVCYAGMIFCARGVKSGSTLVNALTILAAALIAVSLYFVAAGAQLPAPDALVRNFVPLFMLGIVNTGLSCLLYFRAVPQLSASTVSVVGYVEPLTAVVAAALVLGENLSLTQMSGIALLFGAASLSQYLGRR